VQGDHKILTPLRKHKINRKSVDIQGHKVRNIIDGRHRITKQSLNVLFVDLELARNNKDTYNITMIQNKKLQ
jgi:hypothetical protein